MSSEIISIHEKDQPIFLRGLRVLSRLISGKGLLSLVAKLCLAMHWSWKLCFLRRRQCNTATLKWIAACENILSILFILSKKSTSFLRGLRVLGG